MTPTRIAVLGGGAGALAAAYQLTEDFAREDVKITVYTRGWRLGGKGASGRDASRHHRIEEHGLHIWFGFYDEAFDLMAKAYDAAGDDRPYATPGEAFTAIEHLALWNGRDARYRIELPSDALDLQRSPQRATDYGRGLMQWIRAVYEARQEAVRPVAPGLGLPDLPEELIAFAEGRGRGLLPRWPLPHAAKIMRWGYRWAVEHVDDRQLLAFFDLFAAVLELMDEGHLLDEDSEWRPESLDVIDALDFRAWLEPALSQKEETLAAPFLRALYDLVFAYPDGRRPPSSDADPPAGEIAAGVYLRGILRIFTAHRGSMMMRMNGGMGDVVFAPLYHALVERGVTFEFFHAVRELEPGEDGRVQRIRMARQARTTPGPAGVRPPYDPLYRPAGGHWAWPNQPDWTQLEVAEDQRGHDFERELDPLGGDEAVLVAGEHFDEVVLGIPPCALGDEGASLDTASPRFEIMRRGIETVATQALQLWLTQPTEAVGLATDRGTITGAYAPPFDTFVDMSQLLADGIEPWPDASGVVAVAYFCGVLEEHEAQDPDAVARVRENARRFLDDHPWKQEIDDALGGGEAGPKGTLDDQYVRANTHGSDRYVLSRPGTIATRLWPDGSGVANLVLAGDWTRSSVDAGCVEAAVSSGRLAASAIAKRRR